MRRAAPVRRRKRKRVLNSTWIHKRSPRGSLHLILRGNTDMKMTTVISDTGGVQTTSDQTLQKILVEPVKGGIDPRAAGQTRLMLPLNCHRVSTSMDDSSPKIRWRRSWRLSCKAYFDSVSCLSNFLFPMSCFFLSLLTRIMMTRCLNYMFIVLGVFTAVLKTKLRYHGIQLHSYIYA
jgi:hypothetical protein